jgi:trimeric autotransporter adhesin
MEQYTISVNSGATVSVTSGFNVSLFGAINVATGGSFTLNNNANLYQSDANATNTGNIIVKRDTNPLIRLDYTMWSSPVAAQQLLAFSPLTSISPNVRFYTYNTTTNLYNSVVSPSTTNFAVGTGYLIRVPYNHPTAPAVWTGYFTGVPNNGTKTVALTNVAAGQRYNAVGNPYPSPISIAQLAADNAANIQPTLYFWRKTNGTSNPSYCTWNMASQTYGSDGESYATSPNGVIQTGQGFIVEAKASATSMQFNNGQRVTNNAGQFFKSTATATASNEAHRIWLNLTGTGTQFSQAVVGYFTNATLGADDYDSKFFNYDGVIGLNTKIDADSYVIQGRPTPFDPSDVVPLNYKVTTAGNYTFTIDHVDGIFAAGQTVYIKDNLDGSYHNISSGPFTFATDAGEYYDRFEVVYQSSVLSTASNDFTSNAIVVYHHQNEVVINTGAATMAKVRVFDIRGRLLLEKKDINASETKVNVGTTNEVLLVEVTTTEGLKATKRVIN